ncbi:MAG: squalene--hopene cyclase, partial [Planctomycetota bacterium]
MGTLDPGMDVTSGDSVGPSLLDRDPKINRPALDASIDAAVQALFSLQHDDGHWRAELEGDSILNSEYLLMKWMLGQEDDPRLPKIVEGLRRLYRSDIHGWGQFPGSGLDVSATVKGYVCLRLAGDAPDEPHMQAIANAILAHGGAERCNSFTNFYLAGVGMIEWDAVPAIPPEMIWLPRWSPFHLDHVSSWTRTMILPLAICTATRPVRHLPDLISIEHLFCNPDLQSRLAKPWRRDGQFGPVNWNNTFLIADRILKRLQHAGAIPTRKQAIEEAVAWILERVNPKHTEGLGAIFPPMVCIQV